MIQLHSHPTWLESNYAFVHRALLDCIPKRAESRPSTSSASVACSMSWSNSVVCYSVQAIVRRFHPIRTSHCLLRWNTFHWNLWRLFGIVVSKRFFYELNQNWWKLNRKNIVSYLPTFVYIHGSPLTIRTTINSAIGTHLQTHRSLEAAVNEKGQRRTPIRSHLQGQPSNFIHEKYEFANRLLLFEHRAPVILLIC